MVEGFPARGMTRGDSPTKNRKFQKVLKPHTRALQRCVVSYWRHRAATELGYMLIF